MRALITGASSGLGAAFAHRLAREGSDLVLVARNEQRLTSLANELHTRYGIKAEVLVADLSEESGLKLLAGRIEDDAVPISLLVNNAGFGLGQDFVGGDLAKEIAALNVMVKAVLVACHAAASAMRRRGSGRIINVSSITALTAQGTYSAHKAWVRTFSEGLAAELAGTGVSVTAMMPGLIRTEFHERSQVDASQWPAAVFTTPQQVVTEALRAANRGRVLVTPTPLYKAAAAATRLAPRWLVRRIAGPSRSGRGTLPRGK